MRLDLLSMFRLLLLLLLLVDMRMLDLLRLLMFRISYHHIGRSLMIDQSLIVIFIVVVDLRGNPLNIYVNQVDLLDSHPWLLLLLIRLVLVLLLRLVEHSPIKLLAIEECHRLVVAAAIPRRQALALWHRNWLTKGRFEATLLYGRRHD